MSINGKEVITGLKSRPESEPTHDPPSRKPNSWERFKRRVIREYLQSSLHAFLLNSLLLIALTSLAGVIAISGGFAIPPITLLSVVSVPVLVVMYEVARLVDENPEMLLREDLMGQIEK